MKIHEKGLGIPLVIIVLLLMISIQPAVRATELTADNFNDMNYDGWETYGTVFNRTEDMYYPANSANYSAADKTLRVTGPGGDWLRQLYSVAYLNHSVNYGTWSFDLYVVDTPGHECVIHLLSDYYYPLESENGISEKHLNYSYLFVILTYGSWPSTSYNKPLIEFWYINNGVHVVMDRYEIGPAGSTWSDRWTHFDITRDATGHFDIYLNGTLRLSAQPGVHYIPAGYFQFLGQTGQAIDNLAIYDYIVPHPPDTTTTETTTNSTGSNLTPVLLAVSTIELVVIILLAVVYFRKS
ncbi:MAG: hypothetical protein EAX87_04925 [Candidatus Thorarchaeota archaeon]|nr:hypothetical protein [Candidatus Thorarchaeota archaeon]